MDKASKVLFDCIAREGFTVSIHCTKDGFQHGLFCCRSHCREYHFGAASLQRSPAPALIHYGTLVVEKKEMASLSDWKVPSDLQPRPSDYTFDLEAAMNSVVGLRAAVPED